MARGLPSLAEGRTGAFTVCEQEPCNLLAESTGVTSSDWQKQRALMLVSFSSSHDKKRNVAGTDFEGMNF